jgi:hypothetical protein
MSARSLNIWSTFVRISEANARCINPEPRHCLQQPLTRKQSPSSDSRASAHDALLVRSLKRLQTTSPISRRDSLKNGGLNAAVLFAVCLCEAVGEEGGPPCWRRTLAVGAIGAGVGATAGVRIDAVR